MNTLAPTSLSAHWLGRRRYGAVLELQEQLFAARQAGAIGDTLLLCEHEPVITLGRGAKAEHILASEAALRDAGIDVVSTGRGGDVTLHAPGQLVAYPIVQLPEGRRDVRRYVRDLGETMRGVAARYGIDGGFYEPHIGLWVDRTSPNRYPGSEHAGDLAKIGAIGVRLSRWVTMHGFALNLTTDLRLFGLIVPCGIQNHGVTSVAELTARAPETREAAEIAFRIWVERFAVTSAHFHDRAAAPLGKLLTSHD